MWKLIHMWYSAIFSLAEAENQQTAFVKGGLFVRQDTALPPPGAEIFWHRREEWEEPTKGIEPQWVVDDSFYVEGRIVLSWKWKRWKGHWVWATVFCRTTVVICWTIGRVWKIRYLKIFCKDTRLEMLRISGSKMDIRLRKMIKSEKRRHKTQWRMRLDILFRLFASVLGTFCSMYMYRTYLILYIQQAIAYSETLMDQYDAILHFTLYLSLSGNLLFGSQGNQSTSMTDTAEGLVSKG